MPQIPRVRTILVTGGTGTLGAAVVRALCDVRQSTLEAPLPIRVVANYFHDEGRAHTLRSETGCELWRADVGDEEIITSMFEAAGSLRAVIHAAGVSRDGLAANYPRAAWRANLRTNSDGSFLVTRAALKYLEDDGRLILFGSRAGETGNWGQSAYAASKAATIALAKCAAIEAAGRVTVNVLCPGFVPGVMSEGIGSSHLEWQRARSVDGQLGRVEPVVSAVQWLLSDGARGVSGQVIHCDSRLW